MRKQFFQYRSRFPFPAESVFQWYERPGAFERLNPPWESVHVISRSGGIRDGDRMVLRFNVGPFGLTWNIIHQDYIENRQFCDIQVSGPFSFWKHTHCFEPDGSGASYLEDRIEYALPMGWLGQLGDNWLAQKRLAALFAYRHRTTLADLTAHARYNDRGAKRILVSGASGLIGSALASFLSTGGHTVYRLARNSSRFDKCTILWPATANLADDIGLEGFDAVVHLAGESIAGRWTDAKKQRIRDSRILGTRKLCQMLSHLKDPPQTLICASAIGFYGNRGDEILTEQSAPGDDFLATTCQDWERESHIAEKAGIRVVHLRFGVVLTPAGGALAQMLTPFRLGIGGVIGNGSQYVSWISLDDVLGAILHALMTGDLQGPVNVVSPNPVTNRELSKTLGTILHRPACFPLPSAVVNILFGEMGNALLLSSARVSPARLLETGYSFRHPTLHTALQHLLGKHTEDGE